MTTGIAFIQFVLFLGLLYCLVKLVALGLWSLLDQEPDPSIDEHFSELWRKDQIGRAHV
jgi:hypothetical protein